VLISRDTIVLSRSQFLNAEIWAVVQLSDAGGEPAEKVEIVEAFGGKDTGRLKGVKVTVVNLHDAQGYRGPGRYILPLRHADEPGTYEIALVPISPRFTPRFVHVVVSTGPEDGDRIARLAHEDLGLDEQQTRTLLKDKELHPMGWVQLERNVPWERADAFRAHVYQADPPGAERKDAPEVKLIPNDVRIYPLTPDTREQLDEMLAALPRPKTPLLRERQKQ
jgi:hypothetical protein